MLLQLRSQINTRFGACWAWKLEHRVYMQLWWVRSNLRSPSMEHRVFTECTSSCGESDLTSTHPAWNTERTHPAVVSQILPPLTQHGTQSVHPVVWVWSYLHSPSMEHRVYIQWCESDLTSTHPAWNTECTSSGVSLILPPLTQHGTQSVHPVVWVWSYLHSPSMEHRVYIQWCESDLTSTHPAWNTECTSSGVSLILPPLTQHGTQSVHPVVWVWSYLHSPSMEHRVYIQWCESDLTSTHPAWNTECTSSGVSQILPPLTQHGTQSVHPVVWVRSYLHSPSMEHRVYIQWCESDLTSTHPAWNTECTSSGVSLILPPLTQHGTQSVHPVVWVWSYLHSPSMEHRVYIQWCESDLTSTHPAWNTECTSSGVSLILPPLTQHGTQSVHPVVWVWSYLHSPSMEHRVYIQWCESDLTSTHPAWNTECTSSGVSLILPPLTQHGTQSVHPVVWVWSYLHSPSMEHRVYIQWCESDLTSTHPAWNTECTSSGVSLILPPLTQHGTQSVHPVVWVWSYLHGKCEHVIMICVAEVKE